MQSPLPLLRCLSPSTLPLMQETVLILSLQMELLAAALKPGLEGLFFSSPFSFLVALAQMGKATYGTLA